MNQGVFSVSGEDSMAATRRRIEEAQDIAAARRCATFLPPAPTNAELRAQFMSPEALALKRTPAVFLNYTNGGDWSI